MSSGQGRGRGRGRGRAVPKTGPGPGMSPNIDFPPLSSNQQDSSQKVPSLCSKPMEVQMDSTKGRGRSSLKTVESRVQDINQPGTSSSVSDISKITSVLNFEPSKSERKIANRPAYGTLGRPIELVTNYFQLKMSGTIYHYDVEITSLDQKRKYGKNVKTKQRTAAEAAEAGVSRLEHELSRGVGKLRRKEVFVECVRSQNLTSFHPVFDGVKNVFTSKPLPFGDKQVFEVNLEVERKTRKYEVVLQPVKKESGTNKIFLESLQGNREGESEIIMALNSIMNYRDPKSTQIQVGRSFFYLNQTTKINLGEGLEIWFGYHQSVHSTEKGAAIVINLAAKAFHQDGPVIGYINDLLHRDITHSDPMKPYEVKNVSDALKGVKVEVTHLPYPRRFTIEGISKLSANDMKLDFDNKNMSIAKYFEIKYGRLHYPFLHCLFMRSSNQKTYIPFEHCVILKGQPKLGKLSPSLGAKMIKQTAVNPNDRFTSISKSTKDVTVESGEQMRNYNLLLNLRNMQVGGRVLDFPALAYNEKNIVTPDQRGVWNMTGNFFKSQLTESENSWIILDFANCSDQTIDKFLRFFKAAGRKVGLNFGKLIGIRHCGRNVSADQALRDAEKSKAIFAVIILSRRDYYHSYDEIKFIADYKLRFVNQCIDSNVLNRFNDQIATNICLKINVKLGGINHVLLRKPVIFSKPVMIVGADAVHSPRGARCPSIAAVVGSMDSTASKYKIACRVQENPDQNKISQELILEMRGMMSNLLQTFYNNTRGKHPEKIIFFRDGVSEGQFQKTFEYEVSEIQKACQDIFQIIVPITFIVVQKRHQTRFKPANFREGVGRGGNIPPGTTVDRDIVHPHRFDYFLNSHEGIQGTSKPAHYTVLHDDNKFSPDELQELCYHLCYTYNKCNRSISIPAPVKYADLACYRAKKYADFHLQKEQESSSSSSNSSVHLPDHAKQAINTMGDQGRNFFFV